jgi:transcriptional regulator with XRE-family HTH domain
MNTKIAELLKDPEFQKTYAVEGLLADAAELIWQLLVRRKMKQADLARLLNKTPAFVSQLLNGKANMTVRTLAEVASVLGATIKIEAVDANANAGAALDCPQVHTFRFPAKCSPNDNAFRFEYSESRAPIDSTGLDSRSVYAA